MATPDAATLRRVISDVTFGWDGGVVSVLAGTIAAIEPGSYLEACYGGPGNLEDLDDAAAEALAVHAGISN